MKDKRIDFALTLFQAIRQEAVENEDLTAEEVAEVKAAIRYFTDLVTIDGIDELENVEDDETAFDHCDAVETATGVPLWSILPYLLDTAANAHSRAAVRFMLHTKDNVAATDARDMTEEEQRLLQAFIDSESIK